MHRLDRLAGLWYVHKPFFQMTFAEYIWPYGLPIRHNEKQRAHGGLGTQRIEHVRSGGYKWAAISGELRGPH